MNDISKLSVLADKININLNEVQLSQFNEFYNLLIEWNSFMNLTAITDFDEVLLKHFIDSIEIIQASDESLIKKIISGDAVSVVDVGTGAGFPSIPLKICFPNLKITMIDSLNKRVKFLNEVINVLNLKGIEALHGRAEDFSSFGKLREHFDIAVSRAVANLSTLSEYCIPYIKTDGLFVSYKSEELFSPKEYSIEELSSLNKDSFKYALSNKSEFDLCKKSVNLLGGEVSNIYKYNLPDSDLFRALLVIKKIKKTPSKYPRKAGLPSKEPIF